MADLSIPKVARSGFHQRLIHYEHKHALDLFNWRLEQGRDKRQAADYDVNTALVAIKQYKGESYESKRQVKDWAQEWTEQLALAG